MHTLPNFNDYLTKTAENVWDYVHVFQNNYRNMTKAAPPNWQERLYYWASGQNKNHLLINTFYQ